MVDLISSRTIDITKLALDGLLERQKAISANTANVETPGYTRKEVNFESQLQNMLTIDDERQKIRGQNSLQYLPSSRDLTLGNLEATHKRTLTPQQKSFLVADLTKGYSPEVVDDTSTGTYENGNNVDLEKEIMDMAKTGQQYNVLSNLEQRSLSNIASAIKGGS
ncbi:hypothetical protein KBA27_01235 [bacterium]|nr:hypothetical protein [bacterium]